jgi:hypothetical protein
LPEVCAWPAHEFNDKTVFVFREVALATITLSADALPILKLHSPTAPDRNLVVKFHTENVNRGVAEWAEYRVQLDL